MAVKSVFYDPDLRVPRRPLAPHRIYHFNVIYNHGTGNDLTADMELALGVTQALVSRLELQGYVNSYYHDRDSRRLNTRESELERVLRGSSVTVLILTPELLSRWRRLCSSSASLSRLLGKPRPERRLLCLSVGVCRSLVPPDLSDDEVLYFGRDWALDVPMWDRVDSTLETLSSRSYDLFIQENALHDYEPKLSPEEVFQDSLFRSRRRSFSLDLYDSDLDTDHMTWNTDVCPEEGCESPDTETDTLEYENTHERDGMDSPASCMCINKSRDQGYLRHSKDRGHWVNELTRCNTSPEEKADSRRCPPSHDDETDHKETIHSIGQTCFIPDSYIELSSTPDITTGSTRCCACSRLYTNGFDYRCNQTRIDHMSNRTMCNHSDPFLCPHCEGRELDTYGDVYGQLSDTAFQHERSGGESSCQWDSSSLSSSDGYNFSDRWSQEGQYMGMVNQTPDEHTSETDKGAPSYRLNTNTGTDMAMWGVGCDDLDRWTCAEKWNKWTRDLCVFSESGQTEQKSTAAGSVSGSWGHSGVDVHDSANTLSRPSAYQKSDKWSNDENHKCTNDENHKWTNDANHKWTNEEKRKWKIEENYEWTYDVNHKRTNDDNHRLMSFSDKKCNSNERISSKDFSSKLSTQASWSCPEQPFEHLPSLDTRGIQSSISSHGYEDHLSVRGDPTSSKDPSKTNSFKSSYENLGLSTLKRDLEKREWPRNETGFETSHFLNGIVSGNTRARESYRSIKTEPRPIPKVKETLGGTSIFTSREKNARDATRRAEVNNGNYRSADLVHKRASRPARESLQETTVERDSNDVIHGAASSFSRDLTIGLPICHADRRYRSMRAKETLTSGSPYLTRGQNASARSGYLDDIVSRSHMTPTSYEALPNKFQDYSTNDYYETYADVNSDQPIRDRDMYPNTKKVAHRRFTTNVHSVSPHIHKPVLNENRRPLFNLNSTSLLGSSPAPTNTYVSSDISELSSLTKAKGCDSKSYTETKASIASTEISDVNSDTSAFGKIPIGLEYESYQDLPEFDVRCQDIVMAALPESSLARGSDCGRSNFYGTTPGLSVVSHNTLPDYYIIADDKIQNYNSTLAVKNKPSGYSTTADHNTQAGDKTEIKHNTLADRNAPNHYTLVECNTLADHDTLAGVKIQDDQNTPAERYVLADNYTLYESEDRVKGRDSCVQDSEENCVICAVAKTDILHKETDNNTDYQADIYRNESLDNTTESLQLKHTADGKTFVNINTDYQTDIYPNQSLDNTTESLQPKHTTDGKTFVNINTDTVSQGTILNGSYYTGQGHGPTNHQRLQEKSGSTASELTGSKCPMENIVANNMAAVMVSEPLLKTLTCSVGDATARNKFHNENEEPDSACLDSTPQNEKLSMGREVTMESDQDKSPTAFANSIHCNSVFSDPDQLNDLQHRTHCTLNDESVEPDQLNDLQHRTHCSLNGESVDNHYTDGIDSLCSQHNAGNAHTSANNQNDPRIIVSLPVNPNELHGLNDIAECIHVDENDYRDTRCPGNVYAIQNIGGSMLDSGEITPVETRESGVTQNDRVVAQQNIMLFGLSGLCTTCEAGDKTDYDALGKVTSGSFTVTNVKVVITDGTTMSDVKGVTNDVTKVTENGEADAIHGNAVTEDVANDVTTVTEDAEVVARDSATVTEDLKDVTNDSSSVTETVEIVTNDGTTATEDVKKDGTTVTEDVEVVTCDVTQVTEDVELVTNDDNAIIGVEVLTNNRTTVTEDVVVVAKDSTLVTEDVVVVAKDSTLVTEGVNVVANDSTLVTENVEIVANDSTLVTEDVEIVAKNSALVTEDVQVVANDSTLVTADVEVVDNDSTLVTEDVEVVDNDSTLVTEDVEVVANDSTLVTEDVAVVDNDSTLVTEDVEVVANDSTLVTEDVEVVANDSTLVTEDVEVVANDSTLVTEDVAVVANDSTLVTEDVEVVANDSTLVTEDVQIVAKYSTLVTEDVEVVANDSTLVTEDVAVVANDSTLVTGYVEVVDNDSTLVTEDVAAVANASTLVTEDVKVLANDSTLVTEDVAAVANDSTLVTEDVAAVANDSTLVTEDVEVVANDSTLVTEDATKVVANDSTLVTEDVEVVDNDSTLVTEDATKVVANDSTLVTEDAKFVANDSTLVTEDAKVVANDSTLVTADVEVVANDSTLGKEDVEVVANDSTLVTEDVEVAHKVKMCSDEVTREEISYTVSSSKDTRTPTETDINIDNVTTEHFNSGHLIIESTNVDQLTHEDNHLETVATEDSKLEIVKEDSSSKDNGINEELMIKEDIEIDTGKKENCNDDTVTNKDIKVGTLTKEYINEKIETIEDVNEESVTKEDVKLDSVTKEDIVVENVTKEDINKESVTKQSNVETVIKEVCEKSVTKEDINEESVTKEDINEENVTKEDINEESVTKEDIKVDAIPKKDTDLKIITKEDTSVDIVTKEDIEIIGVDTYANVTDKEIDTHIVTDKEIDTHIVTDEEIDTHIVTDEEIDTHIVTDKEIDKHIVTDKEIDTHIVTDEEIDTYIVTDKEIDKHIVTDKEIDAHIVTDDEIDTYIVTDEEIDTHIVTDEEIDTHIVTDEEIDTHIVTDKEIDTHIVTDEEIDTHIVTDEQIDQILLTDEQMDPILLTDELMEPYAMTMNVTNTDIFVEMEEAQHITSVKGHINMPSASKTETPYRMMITEETIHHAEGEDAISGDKICANTVNVDNVNHSILTGNDFVSYIKDNTDCVNRQFLDENKESHVCRVNNDEINKVSLTCKEINSDNPIPADEIKTVAASESIPKDRQLITADVNQAEIMIPVCEAVSGKDTNQGKLVTMEETTQEKTAVTDDVNLENVTKEDDFGDRNVTSYDMTRLPLKEEYFERVTSDDTIQLPQKTESNQETVTPDDVILAPSTNEDFGRENLSTDDRVSMKELSQAHETITSTEIDVEKLNVTHQVVLTDLTTSVGAVADDTVDGAELKVNETSEMKPTLGADDDFLESAPGEEKINNENLILKFNERCSVEENLPDFNQDFIGYTNEQVIVEDESLNKRDMCGKTDEDQASFQVDHYILHTQWVNQDRYVQTDPVDEADDTRSCDPVFPKDHPQTAREDGFTQTETRDDYASEGRFNAIHCLGPREMPVADDIFLASETVYLDTAEGHSQPPLKYDQHIQTDERIQNDHMIAKKDSFSQTEITDYFIKEDMPANARTVSSKLLAVGAGSLPQETPSQDNTDGSLGTQDGQSLLVGAESVSCSSLASGETAISGNTSETRKAKDWILPLYKGVCHTVSHPDMPFMG